MYNQCRPAIPGLSRYHYGLSTLDIPLILEDISDKVWTSNFCRAFSQANSATLIYQAYKNRSLSNLSVQFIKILNTD